MEDPVVLLERSLYGHLLAGLLWERQFGKVLLEQDWEKVPHRECFFVHREKGLFLSVYVDDIKDVPEPVVLLEGFFATTFFLHVWCGREHLRRFDSIVDGTSTSLGVCVRSSPARSFCPYTWTTSTLLGRNRLWNLCGNLDEQS